MIEFQFVRDADQGEPSGFDLGDITVTGDQGSVTSRGHTPDQSMMVYLSVTQLLYNLTLLHRTGKQQKFVGVDSSFTIWFQCTKKGVKVTSGGVMIGHVQKTDLFREVIRAVDEFCAREIPALPESDVGRKDLLASLKEFRSLVDECADGGT